VSRRGRTRETETEGDGSRSMTTGLRKRMAAVCSGVALSLGSMRRSAPRPGMRQRCASGQGSRALSSFEKLLSMARESTGPKILGHGN
jgi:hypothetical protein